MKIRTLDGTSHAVVNAWKLICAYGIDGLVLALLNIILTGWDTRGILWVLPDWPHRVCYVLACVCYGVYFPLLQRGPTGRTIGERLLSLPPHPLPSNRSEHGWCRVIGYLSKLIFVILVLLAVLWFLYVAFGLHYTNPADPGYCPWPCQKTSIP